MLKILVASFLCLALLSEGKFLLADQYESGIDIDEPDADLEQWKPHLMDFLELIDIEKLLMVGIKYISDPEVAAFISFAISPEFSKIVYDFESMEEFKEAFLLLESKGYNVKDVVDTINSFFNLSPYEKPMLTKNAEKGISGLMKEIIDALPVEDMKKLFESKLETSPEVAELFNDIHSKEFVTIMEKMSQNPKFEAFKKTFESYGFDFKMICGAFKEIFGEYFLGIFCK